MDFRGEKMENEYLSIDNDGKLYEIKQAFLANAISDLSNYIQLADTKVSIIMGSLVALVAGMFASFDTIRSSFTTIVPCTWIGINIFALSILYLISIIAVFVFGILTIQGHISTTEYKSKWFIAQSTTEYTLDAYKRDLDAMTPKDVVENMTVELYKLNDINRQKSKTLKWSIGAFGASLFILSTIGLLLFINILGGK